MNKKNTHDKLVQKIERLEKEVIELNKSKKILSDNEKKYRQIFNKTPVGICITDEGGKILEYNDALLIPGGYHHDDISNIGSISDLYYHPDDPKKMLSLAKEKGFVERAHLKLKKKNGTPYITSFSLYPISMGDTVCWQSVVEDITDQKKVEKQIQIEKKFSDRLIASSFDGILAFDKNFCYTLWNSGMERISGKKSSDVLGKKAFEVFPFLKETGEDKNFYDALMGKSSVTKDRPYNVKETNQNGYFEGYYSPILDESDNVLGGQAIIRDITKRKIAEQELKKSIHLIEATLKSLTDAVFVVGDKTKTITACNPAVYNIFGYTQDECLGKTTEFLHINRGSLENFREKLYNSIKDIGYLHLTDFKMKRKDGGVFPSEHIVTPLADDEGNPSGWVSVVRDISDRKIIEQQQKDLNNMLETKVKERTADLENLNIALKVLLQKREEDKFEIEEKIFKNYELLVLPFLGKLKATHNKNDWKNLSDILESNLKEIISPFSKKLSDPTRNLTPSEIQISSLIKQGQSNK